MKNRLVWIALMATLFCSQNCLARWARQDEASYAVNFERANYRVHADETYEVIVERQIEILKDDARTSQGLVRMTFDAKASEISVIEAKTINPEGEKIVDPSSIELKPLASSGDGFDEQKQLTIAFPEVRVGSKIFLKYKRMLTKPIMPGFYSYAVDFGWNEFLQKSEVTFDSDIPLFTDIVDPDKKLKVEKTTQGKRHLITIRLASPIFRAAIEEANIRVNVNAVPWVVISSIRKWSDFPSETMSAYEKVISSELPDAFQKIYEKAKKKTDDYDQINEVTSNLQGKIRYFGDWSLIDGAYKPRPLEKIAKTEFGDCKDMSVSTAAILRKLGFETHSALVRRGDDSYIAPAKLPSNYFNHAITWAKKNGHEYWIDATNPTSYAYHVYADIADRPSLVMFPQGAELKRTPAVEATDAVAEISLDLDFSRDPLIRGKGELGLLKSASNTMTGRELSASKDQVEFSLIDWLIGANRLNSWKFQDYDLTSRIVRDLRFKFDFEESWRPVQTSLGPGYIVYAPPGAANAQTKITDRVTPIQMMDPHSWHRTVRFHGKEFLLASDRGCEGKSKWIDFSRQFKNENGEIVLVDDVASKVRFISVEDLKSRAFDEIQKKLIRCFQDAVVIAGEGAPRNLQSK